MLYHGTSTNFLSSIKREGLKPVPENRYAQEVDAMHWASFGEHGVYVTPNKTTAMVFAQFRADWMRAKLGQVVLFNGVNGKLKVSGEVMPNAKPLLVVISGSVPLHHDENAEPDQQLLWTASAISPEYLTFVPLPDNPESMIHKTSLDGMTLAAFQREYIAEQFPGHSIALK